MEQKRRFGDGRILVVAFEGWNDAGEAASGAVTMLRDALGLVALHEADPEQYFDYQFTRPVIYVDDEGKRRLRWPSATVFGPPTSGAVLPRSIEPETPLSVDQQDDGDSDDDETSLSLVDNIFVLVGSEPSRGWKSFAAEILDQALVHDITGIVVLGAMLADVPHTRPISVFSSSESAEVRLEFGMERSAYEGPVGILSVLADVADVVGIPTVSIWASVPHYVHNAPSPKATLALIEKLEEIIGVPVPRGDLEDEAAAWESGIDALAGDDEDMAAYIEQLEQARDTVDSPEASGEAIAQEFEQYLRKRGDGRDGFADGRENPL
ncbi:PAC2 family protein [Amnibacterium flavum]|uniref:Carboxylate--amine ligase n=1 Tax=Amnibacterium flavum TaxID=2173173 RepID=A0A2V1HU92_9MICO|nr:PAC2 family protein [Amnibacterium flavum]PVZ94609.1 carboxylate--amine ligase [Amnibacterium flavum]